MDLFNSLNKAVMDYTSGAFDNFDSEDVNGLLKTRIDNSKTDMENSLEQLKTLCEPVVPPKSLSSFIEYFCGNSSNPEDNRKYEERRVRLYKLTSTLVRSYADIANDMDKAGYSNEEAEKIKTDVDHFESLKTDIKLASGDYIDLKVYEPAMRHLIDTYISASESKQVSAFDDLSIVDLIARDGVDAAASLPSTFKKDRTAVAETIENNVRRIIVQNSLSNPKYFEKMSLLLDEIIRERRNSTVEYEAYLKRIAELAKKVKGSSGSTYPSSINTDARRALYDNLGNNQELAVAIDERVREKKADSWRENPLKERGLRIEIKKAVQGFGIVDDFEIDKIMDLVRSQRDY